VAVSVAPIISSEALAAFVPIAFVKSIAAVRIRAPVAIAPVVTPINVSPEMLATVVPGSGAEEDAIGEPLRAVVAVGSTFVRSVIEVSVRADGSRTDLYRDLGVSRLCRSCKEQRGKKGQE